MKSSKCRLCTKDTKGTSKTGLCGPCSQKERFKNPKEHPNYKHGRTFKQNYCIDCECKITWDAKRCLKCEGICRSKRMFGKDNPMFGKKRPKQSIRMKIDNPIFKCAKGSFVWKGGYYRGIWMRSNWEINIAKWLDLSNIKWKYEQKTFDLGNTTYTPDFYLPEFKCYLEIKGWFSLKMKKKINKFKKVYKGIKLHIWKKKELEMIGVPIR